MTLAAVAFGAVGSTVAVLTLLVNVSLYRLQRAKKAGPPGERLSPTETRKILGGTISDPVLALAAGHVFVESTKKRVGYIDRQDIGVYLDLHSAACDPNKRASLGTALGDFIRQVAAKPGLANVSLASPREGNLLVGSAAAQHLGLNFLMVRTGSAPRFGYPIEGVFLPGTTAILVDDLCMEATFLARCVKLLRRYGLNISQCICLFERLDGNAREGLADVAVEMHSMYQIDDDELARLKTQGEIALEVRHQQEERKGSE